MEDHPPCLVRINQTEKPRRWGRLGESEMGGATVMSPCAGHKMPDFTLIYVIPLG